MQKNPRYKVLFVLLDSGEFLCEVLEEQINLEFTKYPNVKMYSIPAYDCTRVEAKEVANLIREGIPHNQLTIMQLGAVINDIVTGYLTVISS